MLCTSSLLSRIDPTPSFQLTFESSDYERYGTPALREFLNIFFTTDNNKFGSQASSEPPAWEEFSLEQYPNYGMLTEAKEFRIEEQWIDDASSFRGEYVKNHSEKQFSLYLVMDSERIGKYSFPVFKNGKTEFIDFFDMGIDLTSDLGFTQWSMCASDKNIKTTLVGKVYFRKGDLRPYEIRFYFPSNPVEYSMSLMKLGWKG